MEILRTIAAMQTWADRERLAGRRIGFVPTMGYLHAGHASLMGLARAQSDRLVVSIFVNPTQFGPHEDLAAYPRDFARDEALCKAEGVDAIYFPDAAEMYPPGAQTWVEVTEVSQDHCGASRPGHFRGVATVLTKLFLAVKPHTAVFGEKDFQQLAVIRQMVRDLNFDVAIVGGATVREADGLAMSSRNRYLSPGERARALALSQGLRDAQAALDAGERSAAALRGLVAARLDAAGAVLDYIHLVDADTLRSVDVVTNRAVMLIAAKIGTTRLIDNATLVALAAARAAV
jgi:pantoate--beta-alanine ligase